MSGVSTPDKLGKFEIRGVLGKGAMGTVYDGWDPHIGRRVAIKTVRLQYDEHDEEAVEAVARFKREAQAAGRLSHENIVGVFDYGETDEIAYIVMEFIEGSSLKSLVDPGLPVAPARTGELMLQVLAGLDYSHRKGIVHRDIKPANVMLTPEGKVKLADFGIAKIASSSMTSVGVILGTPAYMPPEQFLGEPADARSDIYAAGAMLFHLLTGKRPYEGNPTSIMQRVLNASLPPLPSDRVTGLGQAWDAVIKKAMARAPEERFQSAAEFAEAVSSALRAPGAMAAHEDADAEATVIQSAPRRGEQAPPPVAKPAPAYTSASASVSASASAPAPAPEAATTRPSSPLPVILGGAVVAIAVAGAGAWFALKPAAPPVAPVAAPVAKPAPTSAPTSATSPAAAPSLDALRSQLAARAAQVPCSYTEVDQDNGVLHLAGVMGESARAALQQASQATGQAVHWDITTIPASYCAAVDVLRPVMRADPLNFVVPEAKGVVTSTMRLHPTISNLPFGAWMYVDYLSGDGTVTHLLPATAAPGFPAVPAKFVAAGGSLRLGEAPYYPLEPGPPYGTDMVIAVASSRPLNLGPRTQGESIAADMAALQGAIDQAKAAGTQVAAGLVVLQTREK